MKSIEFRGILFRENICLTGGKQGLSRGTRAGETGEKTQRCFSYIWQEAEGKDGVGPNHRDEPNKILADI